MSDYGLLQEVRIIYRGSTLDAAAAVGDTQLVVEYAGDFNYDPDNPDDSGGTLDLNGARLTYTSVTYGEAPEDPDTIILSAPLTAAADEDDSVYAVTGGQIAEDWVAYVTMGEGDQVVVPLSIDQRPQWPIGVYADPVPVVVSDDLLHLEDAPGRTAGGRVVFLNTDTISIDGPGTITFELTHIPIDGSEHIRHNGVTMLTSEWSRVGSTVTIPDPGWFLDTDVFDAAYAYDGAAEDVASVDGEPAAEVEVIGWSSSADGWSLPDGVTDGNMLVAVGMIEASRSVTLNDWALVGESSPVTSTLFGGVTYRLVVLSTVYDSGSTIMPTVPGGFPGGSCVTAAFDGGSRIDAAFATVSTEATTGSTPALVPSSIRIWATLADTVDTTPSRGTVIANVSATNIDIVMTLDSATSPAPATTDGPALWCMASLTARV